MIWAIFAAMTALAAWVVLMPMGRAARSRPTMATPDVLVYAAQLSEVDRDVERGMISPPEADGARAEITRRLLRVSGVTIPAPGQAIAAPTPRVADLPEDNRSKWRRRAATVLAVALVPVFAVGFYLWQGQPDLPDAPLSERFAENPTDLAAMVARVEARLAADPEDGRGWRVIAPVYLQVGRPQDAVVAYRNTIRLDGPDPVLEAGLGESLTMAAGGMVTDDALKAFTAARNGDPNAVKPRFYLALALTQSGRKAEAIAAWDTLLSLAQGNEPWVAVARSQVAALRSQMNAPPPAASDLPVGSEAIAALPPAERRAMIEKMVTSLAERLRRDGGTIKDWLRLVRSYQVIGDMGAARDAVAEAKAALSGDDMAQQQLDEAARALGRPN